ncbi:MAG: type IV secretion system protein [Betaproteobacteria bacterium HGW-Betaproteobacteria-16]|nr:MAG: type IV secretion system protein [Betaproteobacteria bacterium HGW-Betaproteobacteria-16]
MFSRKPKDKQDLSLSTHSERPPGMYEDASQRFSEIYGSSMVNGQRMFILAVIAMGLVVATVFAFFQSASDNVAQPWLVEVNPETGLVDRPVRITSVRPSDAVIKAELARWATKVFTIDKVLTPDYFRDAIVMSRGLAISQFSEFRVSQDIVARMVQDPTIQRTPTITSVDVSQSGVAFVFLTTREARANISGAETTRYRLTLKYEISPPKTEREILNNPLGLFVTSMNVSEEGAVR